MLNMQLKVFVHLPKDGKDPIVIIDFSKPLDHMELPPAIARRIVSEIAKAADQCDIIKAGMTPKGLMHE